MTPEQQDKLFQAFSQADTSTTRQFGGTGLGLIISQRMAQMLGGKITVKSQHGQGTTFTVTIATGPLDDVRWIEQAKLSTDRPEQPSETKPTTSTRIDGVRVLLAEDGPDNQRLISFVLRKHGATVELAENGRIACDKATAAMAKGEPFDVILMDMQMPELDGYGATNQLRTQGYTSPIIALTAHAMADARNKCLDAGCDDYTTKPIDRTQLISLIAKYARPNTKPAPQAPIDSPADAATS